MGLVPLPTFRGMLHPPEVTHTLVTVRLHVMSDEKHADRIACDNSRLRGYNLQ